MYKISQFSKISGLSVKALRYYDEENILKPSLRNTENQYRYYADKDLGTAQRIKLLRSLDFSIMEIKEVIENVHTDEDLSLILQEKINMIKRNMAKETELMQSISAHITTASLPQQHNNYAIDVVNICELTVASIRFTGAYSELDTYVPRLYKALKGNRDGCHFNLYYDEGYAELADIELCIPVKKVVQQKGVTLKQLPAITALRTIHHGTYEDLYLAYQALFAYSNQHNISILVPSRELYHKGPGMIFKGNPASYVTEILLPFVPSQEEKR